MDPQDQFTLAISAHLGGSVVLSLFYLLLARHEPRPYLREWTAAWIAQTLALGVLLSTASIGFTASITLFLFLQTAHGLLLCGAALTYTGTSLPRRLRVVALVTLVVWSAVAPLSFPSDSLVILSYLAVAATSVGAAAILWPRRDRAEMGVRLTTNALALLGLLYVVEAGFHGALDHVRGPVAEALLDFLRMAPFLVLFLQMLLGLAMVLGVMENAQWALASANARLREAQHRLQLLADTDPLTGCYNRRVFRDLVDEMRAEGGRRQGALLLVDMDGLKAINDRDGHDAGDRAIRTLAETLREKTRATDMVVRWGGDEFVVVLPEASEHDAQVRRDGMTAALTAAGLGASIGLAVYDGTRDVMDSVHEADQDMYRIKSERKAGLLSR